MPAPAAPPTTAAPKAATPAAKPAPQATKPAAKPESTPPPVDQFHDAFADIDAMDTGKPKPEPKKEAAKLPENPSDADGAEKPSETDTTKIGSEDSEFAQSATKDSKSTSEQKPVKAAELRNAYDGLKKKVKEEYEPKLKALESELKTLKSKAPEPDKATKDRIAAIEKRNEELESALRFSNYKVTKEYKDHETNLSNAWASAKEKLSGISISSKNAETNEVSERELTLGDIAGYANLEPKERWSKLRTDIPDPAERTMVINHIDKIVDLSRTLDAAEKKAKEDAETHAKTQKQQQEEFQTNREKFWKEANETYSKQFPAWFAKSEDDQEGNALFDKGIALADLVFFPQSLTDEQVALLPKSIRESIEAKKPFTPAQLTKLHSIIRNKAANHDRLVRQKKTLQSKVAELEKSLKEFEESSPDNVRAGKTNGQRTDVVSYESELDALARTHK